MRIELSDAQVSQVLRNVSTSHVGLLSAVIKDGSGLAAQVQALLAPSKSDQSVSRSLLLGLLVLTYFPSDGSERRVTEVARDLGLQAGTAHRYVSTLVRAGLLEQDPSTRRYRLANSILAPAA